MGAATLVVYLFHGFVVKGAEYAGFMGWADDHAAISLLADHPRRGSLSSLLLAWPPVARRAHPRRRPVRLRRAPRQGGGAAVDAPAQADQIAVAVEEAVAEEAVGAR